MLRESAWPSPKTRRRRPRRVAASSSRKIDVAVVDAPPDQADAAVAAAADTGAILAVEPERWVRALEVETYTPEAPPASGNGAGTPAAEPPPPARSSDYLRGYRDAVLHLTEDPDGRRGRRAATLAASLALDETQATWGAAGDQGGLLLPQRARDQRRGARHRASTSSTRTSPAARSSRSRSCPARRCRTATATARTASAPRWAASARRRAARATASPTSARDLRRQGAQQRRLGLGHGHPRRHQVGDRQQVRRRLDVAGRADAAGPAVLAGLRARRAARAGQGHADRRGRGQRLQPPGAHHPVSHPANCPSIMAVAALDPGLADRVVLQPRDQPGRRADRHRRARA